MSDIQFPSLEPSPYQSDTLAIRSGQIRGPEGEHNDPIYLTSSFVFANAAEAAARFVENAPGNVYSRFTNPTVRTFEQRLASLEGADFAVASSSGMAAIQMVMQSLLKAGDHVVVSANVFGSTVSLFEKILGRFAIESTFVPMTDPDQWVNAIRDNTRILFVETPSNPLCEIADLSVLADIAHNADCLLVVDNVFCTPVLQRPLDFGADVVVHSATKYLDGQGRCVGGAIVTRSEEVHEACFNYLRTAGPSMSPFNAWVLLNGLETLPIRMRAHCDNAMRLATWLEQHGAVTRVNYAGLPSHRHHEQACKQQSGFGGVLSFEVEGGRAAAWRVIDSTRLLSITANLGDVKTTITHPATTTHGRLSDIQRQKGGISEGLIRVAVGLEAIDDIVSDLATGLDACLKPE
ncbi:MAG: O-succinylhomoserine sulfhydrylase [marine bacterium B5-7]|nr:MAG: O-succinylhomoserine sulfhydrylase [marine bacterium B5-7]